MPAGPGDSRLTTLFADVHYYFAPPTAKPQHHRFSRGSYAYLFHNANSRQTKLEIANHAGTPDQDAVSGYLDVARLTYSYKQPTLCTLTIDGARVQGQEQWHLPAYDVRNEQKFKYPLHSLDVYLWTEKDAATFLGHLKAVIPEDRQDIRDAPSALPQKPAEHRDSMSPVVQQLERTAVGTHFPPRAESAVSALSFPGPPTPATSAGAPVSPLPAPPTYNPAAPAAPEPIAYREKTPPPHDDGTGTGLSHAAKYDHIPQTQYANVPSAFGPPSNQVTPQQAYFPGPPQQQQPHPRHTSISSIPGPPQHAHSGSLPPPPPGGPTPPQQQYTPSFAPPPGQAQHAPPPISPPPNQQTFHPQSSYGAPVTQYANYQPQQAMSFGPTAIASPGLPGTPGHAPVPHQRGGQQQQQQQQPPTPSAPPAYSGPLASPGLPGPPHSQPHPAQQQIFAYSNYSYSAPQQAHGYGSGEGGGGGGGSGYAGEVHHQVYRPTEAESLGGHGAKPAPVRTNTGDARQRLEGRVDQVEKKVGGFLKKLDKMW